MYLCTLSVLAMGLVMWSFFSIVKDFIGVPLFALQFFLEEIPLSFICLHEEQSCPFHRVLGDRPELTTLSHLLTALKSSLTNP